MCCGCFAQSSPPGHFEVASVKRSAQKEWGRFRGGPGSKDPERVTYESTPLENLIRDAYHLEPYQLSGPSWLNTEFYTVTAKEPPGTTLEHFRHMLANLLAERFGLVAHRVMKDFAGYEIVVAKGGPKLSPAAPSSDKFPVYQGSRDANGVMRYTFTQTSMKLLTNRIEMMLRVRSAGGVSCRATNLWSITLASTESSISSSLSRCLRNRRSIPATTQTTSPMRCRINWA
jgi:uncharacterized protein (TIGR03435 family)